MSDPETQDSGTTGPGISREPSQANSKPASLKRARNRYAAEGYHILHNNNKNPGYYQMASFSDGDEGRKWGIGFNSGMEKLGI